MDRVVRIVNRTRGTLLSSRSEVAATWWSGFAPVGLRGPEAEGGVLVERCDAVHTWGVRHEVDVIFIDVQGRVLELRPKMKPWSVSRRIPGARYALRVPEGTIEMSGTSVGDVLTWTTATLPARPTPVR
jgi:hypothetical protein